MTSARSGPKVITVILNWNQERDTLECLASLKKQTYENHHIVLVDNGSTDGSEQRIATEFPEILLLRNRVNLGFSVGNNGGIEKAMAGGADYILLLNNDTVVHREALAVLVGAMEADPQVGVAGPTIYLYDFPDQVQSAGARVDFRTGYAPPFRLDDETVASSGDVREVHYVSGCALMMKREVVERVGVLDPRFFNFYEDADFCLRARKAGYKVLHVPKAMLWHKSGRIMSPLRNLYFNVRNRPLFMVKNATGKDLLRFAPNYLRWIFRLLNGAVRTHNTAESKVVLMALSDLVLLRFGRGSFDKVVRMSS